MFSPWTAPDIAYYWYGMAASAAVLLLYASVVGHWWRGVQFHASDILYGIFLAAALWGIFWVGDKVSQWMFPSFARAQVDNVYALREGGSPVLISLLLMLLIGPTEEIFWRGFVQRNISDNRWLAFALTTAAYTLIHVGSLNFMLTMSALVCGIFWGGLYCLFPKRLPMIIISHCIWDAAVFVWFPIM